MILLTIKRKSSELGIIDAKLNFYYKMLSSDLTFKQGYTAMDKIKVLESKKKELLKVK